MFSPIFNNRHQTTKKEKKRGDHNVWHFLRNGNRLLKQRWNVILSHLQFQKRRWCTIKNKRHITSIGIVVVHLQYNLMMITLLKILLYLHFFLFPFTLSFPLIFNFQFIQAFSFIVWFCLCLMKSTVCSFCIGIHLLLSMIYCADVSVSNNAILL